MAAEILTLFTDHFAKPLLDLRIVDIVVIHPAFIARIIWRIDVDALNLSLIFRQQRFQRFQIISVNNHILTFISAISILLIQNSVRYIHMMIDDLVLSDPV